MKMEFGRGGSVSDKKSEELFYVNNCGYYRDINCDINVCRPNGRLDYQIIYIKNGFMYFKLHGENVRLCSGNVVLYRPRQPQIYKASREDNVSYDWIHFSGTTVEYILNSLNLNGNIYKTEDSFSSLCKSITHECRSAQPNEILISSMAITALSIIRRKTYTPFKNVIEKMKSGESFTIEQLAGLCGMSVYHFIRSFRKEFGITPHAYMINERIEKSKFFLSDTYLSVSEISEIIGFDDPLYFSRVFKKSVGVSPKNYRCLMFSGDK